MTYQLDGGFIYAVAPKFTGKNAVAQKAIISAIGPVFASVLAEYGITTRLRIAHFMAQVTHECAGFRTTVEFASGDDYEGREDLGNTRRGDGRRYKGRGLIQLTGRANYRTIGKRLGLDLEGNPEKAADPVTSLRIACEFWKSRALNALADKDDGSTKDALRAVTKKVNGGYNGLADRKKYFRKALAALDAQKPAPAPAADPVYDALPPNRIVDRTTIAQIQADLWAMGFTEVGSRKSDGTFDGVPGKYTEGAVMAFRKEYGLPISANLDLLLIEQMAAAKIEEWKRVMPKREAAPIEEVVDKVPEAAANKATRDTAAGGIVLGVLYAIMDAVVANFNEAKNLVAPLGDYVSTKWVTVLLIILVCIYLYVKAQGGLQSAVARWREGASR